VTAAHGNAPRLLQGFLRFVRHLIHVNHIAILTPLTSLTGTCAPSPRSSRGVIFAGYQCQAAVAVVQQCGNPWRREFGNPAPPVFP
jgi:hypothetical protein